MKSTVKPWVIYISLAIILAFFLFPVFWVITTSLKTRIQAIAMPPVWLFKPMFRNYFKVLFQSPFPRYFANSLIISLSAVFISIACGTPAAYALSRFEFRHKQDLLFWILSTRMAPPIAVIIPFFMMFRAAHMLDSHFALIIVYITFNLSLVIWLMRGFFSELPEELEEAALVDGASELGVFFRIALPLVSPGIVATMILGFLFSWNEFFFALILTRKVAQTVPVAIAGYIGFMGIRWEEMTAAAVISSVPTLVLAIVVQRYLVRGLTLGARK